MSREETDKRQKVLAGNKKFEFRIEWLIPLAVVVAGVLIIVWPRNSEGPSRAGGSHSRVKANDGIVAFPVSTFDDQKAKYYTYKFPEKSVNFFVLKSSDGVVRVAFDACDVCFAARKGYQQSGDSVVCRNCGQVFPSNRINVEKGGCNPAPLERTVVDGDLIIKVTDLYAGLRFF